MMCGGRDKLFLLTDGAMSSSGLKTQNFKFMTNDNKQQELSNTTDTAIAYSTC
jgi:tRNA A37 threonylcarbamoyltransferase TsaD